MSDYSTNGEQNQGWVKLHRSLLEWEWWDDHNTTRLFLFLIIKANHQFKKWRGIEIQRGQLVTSYEQLAKQTTLTVKQVRASLSKLKMTGEVASKSTNKYTIITIQSYDSYQEKGKQEDKRRANEGQAEGKQRATNKNDKNEKNVKNEKNNTSEKKYSKLDDIDYETIEEIRIKLKVRRKYTQNKLEDLIGYCQAKGITYKNYRAALENWIRKDIAEGKAEMQPPSFDCQANQTINIAPDFFKNVKS